MSVAARWTTLGWVTLGWVTLGCVTLGWVTLGAQAPAAAAPPAEEVQEAIADAVRQRRALSPAERVLVSNVQPSNPKVYAKARSIVGVELPPGETGVNSVTALVRLEGQSDAPVWVLARVQVERQVIVARHAIARGAELRQEDLELRWQSTARAGEVALRADELVGKRTKSALRPGDAVDPTRVEAPPIVQRGDDVHVRVQGRGFVLTSPGEILDRGGRGELVRVRVHSTGKIVQARVHSPQSVEVVMGGI